MKMFNVILALLLVLAIGIKLLVNQTPSIEADNALLERAVKEERSVVCQAINNNDIKTQCILEVAVVKQSLLDCQDIDEIRTKNACITKVAVELSDPSPCAQIKNDDFYHDICYRDIALKTDNEKLCAAIQEENDNNKCFSTIAVRKNDPQICRLASVLVANDCIYKIAQNTLSFELCSEVRDEVQMSVCRASIAKKKNDVTLCEKIDVIEIREKCSEVVGK